ncbi:MAG: hypothetical protein KA116_09650 [Proteobacteria bacterium]|nr:hypothetical protein [Pseudomonadota bacterium]
MNNSKLLALTMIAFSGMPLMAKVQGRSNPMIQCLKEELKPTKKELLSLRQEMKSVTPKIRELKKEVASKRTQLKELLGSSAGEAEVKEFLASYKNLRNELMSLQVDRILIIRAKLSPEQRKKWGECQDKIKAQKNESSSEE